MWTNLVCTVSVWEDEVLKIRGIINVDVQTATKFYLGGGGGENEYCGLLLASHY